MPLPGLARLLGRGRTATLPDWDMEAALCALFAIEKQADWPVAPLTLAADHGAPDEKYWLRADPVHLRVQRDHVILADSGTFSISQAEAEQLTATLNAHFQDEGFVFYPMRPDRWYLGMAQAPDLTTSPITQVIGHNIDPWLPRGGEGLKWHRYFNEIQMLFHDHPVNEARAAAGDLPVNSIWLWGGGTMPTLQAPPADRVWSRETLSVALANATSIPFETPPASAAHWIDEGRHWGNHLIVLDDLTGASQYGDVIGWREALLQLEQHWFSPLWKALQRGTVSEVVIETPGRFVALRCEIDRRAPWRIWKRSRELRHFLPPGSGTT